MASEQQVSDVMMGPQACSSRFDSTPNCFARSASPIHARSEQARARVKMGLKCATLPRSVSRMLDALHNSAHTKRSLSQGHRTRCEAGHCPSFMLCQQLQSNNLH
eukprot:1835344-Amphidinium_carterae.1